MAVLLAVIQPILLVTFGGALLVTGAVLLGLAYLEWQRFSGIPTSEAEIAPMEPFDVGSALGFGVFLAAVAILVPAAKEWLGAGGIYALSAASGLADVDAIVISLARIHGAGELATVTVIIAMSLATLANMVTKASIAWVTGGREVGRAVCKGYAIAMLAGGLTLALIIYLL
jgi:uncharacterized membrane protein (DUF4010 family)